MTEENPFKNLKGCKQFKQCVSNNLEGRIGGVFGILISQYLYILIEGRRLLHMKIYVQHYNIILQRFYFQHVVSSAPLEDSSTVYSVISNKLLLKKVILEVTKLLCTSIK